MIPSQKSSLIDSFLEVQKFVTVPIRRAPRKGKLFQRGMEGIMYGCETQNTSLGYNKADNLWNKKTAPGFCHDWRG